MSTPKIKSNDEEAKRTIDIIDGTPLVSDEPTDEEIGKSNLPKKLSLDSKIPIWEYSGNIRSKEYNDTCKKYKINTDDGIVDRIHRYSTLPYDFFNFQNFVEMFKQLFNHSSRKIVSTDMTGICLQDMDLAAARRYINMDLGTDDGHLRIHNGHDNWTIDSLNRLIKVTTLTDTIDQFAGMRMDIPLFGDKFSFHEAGWDYYVESWLQTFYDDAQMEPATYEAKRQGKWENVPFAMFKAIVSQLRVKNKLSCVMEAFTQLISMCLNNAGPIHLQYNGLPLVQQSKLFWLSGYAMRQYPDLAGALVDMTADQDVLVFPDENALDVYKRLMYVLQYMTVCRRTGAILVLFPRFYGTLASNRTQIVSSIAGISNGTAPFFIGHSLPIVLTYLQLVAMDNIGWPHAAGNDFFNDQDLIMTGVLNLGRNYQYLTNSEMYFGRNINQGGFTWFLDTATSIIKGWDRGLGYLMNAIRDRIITVAESFAARPLLYQFTPIRLDIYKCNVQDMVAAIDLLSVCFGFDHYKTAAYHVSLFQNCLAVEDLWAGHMNETWLNRFHEVLVPTSSKFVRLAYCSNGAHYTNTVVEDIKSFDDHNDETGLHYSVWVRAYFRAIINRLYLQYVYGSMTNVPLVNNDRLRYMNEATRFIGSVMMIPYIGQAPDINKYNIFDTCVYTPRWIAWDEDPYLYEMEPLTFNYPAPVDECRNPNPREIIELCEWFIPEIDWLNELFGPLPAKSEPQRTTMHQFIELEIGKQWYSEMTSRGRIQWSLGMNQRLIYPNNTEVIITAHRTCNYHVRVTYPIALSMIDDRVRIEVESIPRRGELLFATPYNTKRFDGDGYNGWPLRWIRHGTDIPPDPFINQKVKEKNKPFQFN